MGPNPSHVAEGLKIKVLFFSPHMEGFFCWQQVLFSQTERI